MQNEKKELKEEALKLLMQNAIYVHITYEQNADKTGFSKRQIIRWAEQLKERDMSSILTHSNTGRKPVTTAYDQEISYLENFNKTYLVITIAQFRDIYREDVLFSGDPQKRDEVQRFGLKDRSKSCFWQLYMHEGWRKCGPVYVVETEKDMQRYLSELEDNNFKFVKTARNCQKMTKL